MHYLILDVSQEATSLVNETLFEKLASRDPVMVKEAIDAVNDFTRTRMREDGFLRRIMPPVPISNEELDRQATTDKPVKVIDKEPDSPTVISIPFATSPMNIWIRGPRYMVMMDRILKPRFTKDVDELRTWIMDKQCVEIGPDVRPEDPGWPGRPLCHRCTQAAAHRPDRCLFKAQTLW